MKRMHSEGGAVKTTMVSATKRKLTEWQCGEISDECVCVCVSETFIYEEQEGNERKTILGF